MSPEPPHPRFLLDERYPGWLALSQDGVVAVALTAHRSERRGVDDRNVLRAAVGEGRVVVTEDVTTFAAAIAAVADHVGVVSSHHAGDPRTGPGLHRLRRALVELHSHPPPGLGRQPVEWWLPAPPN